MKRSLLVLFFCSICTILIGQEEQLPVFSYNDVFELEVATNANVSPDGETIVYARNYFDIMTDQSKSDLWMVDASGTHLPFLSMDKTVSSPTWSPDGERVAFVSSDGNKPQIHIYWMESRRWAPITRLTESPSSITWSPSGKHIAFFMRVPGKPETFATMPAKPEGAQWAEPPQVIDRLRYRADGRGFLPFGHTHLFVVSADGGTIRQITDGDFDHGGSICWLPDEQSIILSANRRADADYQPRNSELYQVDLATRKVKQLTDRNGPDSNPFLMGEANQIGYLGFDDQMLGQQNNQLYVLDLETGSNRCVIESFERQVSSPKWCKFHQGVLFTYADKGNTKLAVAKLDGSIQNLADNLGTNALGRPYGGGDSFSVSETGVVAFSISTPDHPGELARVVGNQPVEQLTDLNSDLLSQRSMGKTEEIWFKSSHDGTDIQGWYILPPNFDASKKYPLILEIHGGPFANYGDRFTAELQLMAAHGYVVLYTNPRGSTSYGEDFANLIHHNYPGNDYDDLISGVDSLIAKGFIDEDQLFVTGGSGGGVLTAWIVGKTDRFRAAVVAKPVINWYSFALTADMYNYFYKYWFPGYPWDHTEEYMKRSPISLVGNVNTPTMLLTGAEDYRTPMSETEQYYQALKLRGIDTKLIRIPGAGHGIASRPSNLIAKVAFILKWFQTH